MLIHFCIINNIAIVKSILDQIKVFKHLIFMVNN